MRHLVLSLLFWCCCATAQVQAEQPRVIIVTAQQMIDGGEISEAIEYLREAAAKHPDNDLILALYGQALYENRQIEQAEKVFMLALKVNPLNTVAKSYIEVIRETSAASVSEQIQQLQEVTWDKVGDLVAMALAFTLGGVLAGLLRKFAEWRFERKSRELFLRGYYEDFSDLLEIQLSTNELRPLRNSLKFMLEHKSMDDAVEILNRYVNTDEHLRALTRMLKLSRANEIR